MLRTLRTHLFYAFALLSTVSCDMIDREEDIPAWIEIDSFRVLPDAEVDAGSLSSDIVDAWVFIDDEMLGIFELPARIPVLVEGEHNLLVGPGIKVSTSSSLRDNYLFYNAYEVDTFHLRRDAVRHVDPTCTYRDPTGRYSYNVIEDFEDITLLVDTVTGSDAPIQQTDDPSLVYEGTGSGLIEVDDNVQTVAMRTPFFELPGGDNAVFIELDYYSDYYVQMGVFVNNDGISDEVVDYLVLRPTTDEEGEESWKKVYIGLSSIIGTSPYAENFYFYFNVEIAGSERTQGRVMFDNIKLMYEL